MARSKCGFCSGSRFELSEVSPQGSKYKMQFIQCTACGVPVGVAPYLNTEAMIQSLEEKIDVIKRRLSA